MDRRNFLRLVTATGAGIAAGCNTRQAENLLPYVDYPKEMTPGTAVYYATTCVEDPDAAGMLARTREGRVVKLEGNPQHPLTRGTLSARCQAAVQGLYNPDRLTKPMARNESGELTEISWEEALNRLQEAVSGSGVAWLTGHTADSDVALIQAYASAAGQRAPMALKLFPEKPLADAAAGLFGTAGMPEFHFENADLVVSVNADFLETWGMPISQTQGFTRMHGAAHGGEGTAIYIGPRQSTTAVSCDKWIRIRPGLEAAALRVMAEAAVPAGLAADILASVPLAQAEAALGETTAELRAVGEKIAAAEAPLVIAAGLGEDAELAHALALLITHAAGGTGKTLSLPNSGRPARGDSLGDIAGLINDFGAGAIGTLCVHEANPAFQLPSTVEDLEAGGNLVYFGTQFDETAARADLVIPTHHYLESWGWHASSSTAVGIVQPVMRPIFGSRALADLILELSRNLPSPLAWENGREYVESRISAMAAERGETGPLAVRHIKKRGGFLTASEIETAELVAVPALPTWTAPGDGNVAHFFPHPYLYDGSGADKPWLQEVPESTTSVVWGSWAEINPETAASLGVDRGDAVSLTANEREITVPVLPTPQVMPGVIAVPIGQGHEKMGRYARGRGANPLTLCGFTAGRTSLAVSGVAVDIAAVKGGGTRLVTMAGSQDQGERELARAIREPKEEHHDEHEHHVDIDKTFYPKKEYDLYDWGMTIDLDSCTGCGACAVACYAENNLGVVGEELMRQGREMSWIRIEKYVEGDDARMLVNLCQQCHHAPCEPVCPVQAAYHNDEGLNAQVYNRCVGTRYCSNNCPYKVRRFNWFDYKYPAPLHLQLNPDVTVRERGVMEKCTFCVQRIKIAKEEAKNHGVTVTDGSTYMDGLELQPACAQTCPADAITFGNLKEEGSRVSKQFNDKRAYRLLEELGTRPSVTYLKKVIRTDV